MNCSLLLGGFIHESLRRRATNKFGQKLQIRMKNRPDLFAKKVSRDLWQRHKDLYGAFGLPLDENYLRMYCNISGIDDYRYVPDNIYLGCIERVLNDCNRSGFEGEDKNECSLFVDKKYQPRYVLRFIRGCFFDEDYQFISDSEADSILKENQGDLIGKIAVDNGGGSSACGGHGITCFSFVLGAGYLDKSGRQLTSAWIRENFISYVVQERIEQCEFSAQFNPYSANTCRIITLRCPWNGKTIVAKAGMRLGVSENCFDNLSSGGIGIVINQDGSLSKYAYDWLKLIKYERHPSSGICFDGQYHPFYSKMAEIACDLASRVPNYNVISWDFLADKQGKIKILEMNLTRQGTDFVQFDDGPLFGDETERVVEWCLANRRYDSFRHIRGWY